MKKKLLGVISILILLSTAATTVLAAPKDLKSNVKDPFQATYKGVVHGDKGSQALLTLALSQVNDQISGTVYLGSGLYINAGRCGGGYLPAAVQSAEGEVNKYKPNLIEASTAFKVSGFKVAIDLEGLLSSDGDVLETEAKIDLPWLCGQDPIINGTLYRQQS